MKNGQSMFNVLESSLATKQDIKALETELKKYVGDQNLKLVGIVAALLAIFKFLPDFFQ